jgi:uncharacterized circularly permuted ATP-grasp superfamily protein/uncharacterized alpha-E superfamily protein
MSHRVPTSPPEATAPAVERLLRTYRRDPSIADEVMTPDGSIRPVWQRFLSRLSAIPREEITRRFALGDQYLHDAGVYVRSYEGGAGSDRDWPLSHIPLVLDAAEWQGIASGLKERANLLESVMADLYGPQDLLRSGLLPPELVLGNPEWLRPMVGIKPASGHYLHFLAFEIGRNPDGSWFVLGDRTEAPSGAGFALENRVATMRVFSDPIPGMGLERLKGFFESFAKVLDPSHGLDGMRSAILTPGPGNEAYFEHTFIARYLGLLLLEGEDLIVKDGRALVRTVDGPQPISTLWRRLDAAFADPLELNERSRIGTPGLIGAVRAGHLEMVNALGSGVLQTRAFLAFLPAIARHLQGRPLALPNIATWWCGQDAERDHVLANADTMMISRALSQDLPFEVDGVTALAGRVLGQANDAQSSSTNLSSRIRAAGGTYVGQEAVSLSTTAAWSGDGLEARPMMLRVFAARTPTGWQIMPGGYARIGQSEDVTALSLRRGGSVADVWVVSTDAKADPVLARTHAPVDYQRGAPSLLPARAADNLYWLGRYVGRAEGLIRLIRARALREAETSGTEDQRHRLIDSHMREIGVTIDAPVPDALRGQIGAALDCAAKVRDRFSVDGWLALADLDRTCRAMVATPPNAGDGTARAMGLLLRRLGGFSGLVGDNMYRFTGWRFLSFGRALERAQAMALLLRDMTDDGAPQGGLEIAVEVGDSVMTHRRRYRIETTRETVIDLLALDAANPRSIRSQLDTMEALAAALPGADPPGPPPPLIRALRLVATRVAVSTPEEMTPEALGDLADELGTISELLTATYLR